MTDSVLQRFSWNGAIPRGRRLVDAAPWQRAAACDLPDVHASVRHKLRLELKGQLRNRRSAAPTRACSRIESDGARTRNEGLAEVDSTRCCGFDCAASGDCDARLGRIRQIEEQ